MTWKTAITLKHIFIWLQWNHCYYRQWLVDYSSTEVVQFMEEKSCKENKTQKGRKAINMHIHSSDQSGSTNYHECITCFACLDMRVCSYAVWMDAGPALHDLFVGLALISLISWQSSSQSPYTCTVIWHTVHTPLVQILKCYVVIVITAADGE